jgi:homopolymeric O-antigen transport system permease protein
MLYSRLIDVRSNWDATLGAARLLWRRRELLFEMTRRDVVDRYAGQVLGSAWAIIAPLLTMATYMLAFGVIFRSRIGPGDNGAGYVAFALAGLVPWMGLQDCLSRATTAIVGNGNLVKQIVFPSEVLPLKVALGTLPALTIGLVATIGVSTIAGRLDPLGLLVLLPIALVCYILFLAGLSYVLAAIGVFVRDVKDLIAFLLTIGLFLNPILYTPAGTPSWLRPLFLASPFSYMIWCFRDALIGRDPAHAWSWLVFPILSISAFVLGWRTFRMLKPTFGNAL